MPKSKPKKVSVVTSEDLVQPWLTKKQVHLTCQQVHFFSTQSSANGGYDQGINALIKEGKRVVCMQLTREHLIVVTE